jgi:hypothetical protein
MVREWRREQNLALGPIGEVRVVVELDDRDQHLGVVDQVAQHVELRLPQLVEAVGRAGGDRVLEPGEIGERPVVLAGGEALEHAGVARGDLRLDLVLGRSGGRARQEQPKTRAQTTTRLWVKRMTA